MKGIIFNLLEDFAVEAAGEEKFEEILSKCNLKTKEPFVGPGSYPDGDLSEIVDKASKLLGIEKLELIRKFGRFAFAGLAEKFPVFVEGKTAHEFIKSINDIHFIEVKKLYEDANPPRFEYEEISPDKMILYYRSERKLCPLIMGIIEGISDYYKTPIEVKKVKCMLDGAPECVFELNFGKS
ncbi:MAG: heme NO-binding domain-containing protein [Armatimonadota bacterium]